MNNKLRNKTYYIYVDDSGKFQKPNDDYVIYSYLVFDKKGRSLFEKQYIKTWLHVSLNNNNIENGDELYEKCKEDLIMKNGYYGSCLGENPKGSKFIENYNWKIKNREAGLDAYNNFLNIYKVPKYVGSFLWCKECSLKKEFGGEKNAMRKKKYMILNIINQLVYGKILESCSSVKIYLDNEFSENKETNKEIGLYFQNYINTPYVTNEFGEKPNGIIKHLREQEINCSKFEFLDSSVSPFIRAADIIANATNKSVNESKTKKGLRSRNLFDHLRETNVNIPFIIFPHYDYKNYLTINEHKHSIK